jgi:hypothetical protein
VGSNRLSRRRRSAALALAAIFVSAIPAIAEAAPRVGRWTGTSAHGVDVSFTIHSLGGGRRYIANEVSMCVAAGAAAPLRSDVAGLAPGLWSYAWPLDGRGRIRDLPAQPVARRSPLQGRLGRTSGVLHGSFGIESGSACAGALDPPDQSVRVRWVSAEVVESGRWELSGAHGSSGQLWVLGGAATYQFTGTLFAPSLVVPLRSCIGGPGLYDDAWIQPDGSFVTDRPGDWGRFAGRFGGLEASGTYSFELPSQPQCHPGPYDFTARLVERQPPPSAGRLQLPSTPVLPRRTEPVDYVALGDSYSSGEGVPPFDRGTDTRGNRCHRSAHAYSRRLALPRLRLRRSFFACSGAVTDNVGHLDAASGQIGGAVQHPSEAAIQLGRLSPADWSATDMVTLTIGGNDARFGPVLTQCLLNPLPCHRGRRARRIVRRIAREVKSKVASTYAAIARTAPNASAFVLGYPQLFPARPRESCPIGKRLLSRAKQRFLRRRGRQLNAVIRRQAAAAGYHFVDVERSFRGHEPCGPKSEWIHALVLRPDRMFSFHPNRRGQAAYARTLGRYIRCLSAHGWPFLPSGMPENPRRRRVPPACS